jgi:hypothetical protein
MSIHVVLGIQSIPLSIRVFHKQVLCLICHTLPGLPQFLGEEEEDVVVSRKQVLCKE